MNTLSPLDKWTDRIKALRVRKALVLAGGNYRKAAELIGTNRCSVYRIIKRDNARIEAASRAGITARRAAYGERSVIAS